MEKSGPRNVVMTVPELPRYSKLDSIHEPTPGTKYRVLGLCVVSVVLLAFLGVVFLALHPSNQDWASDTLLQAENIELKFDCRGHRHKETVRVSKGGNTIQIVDAADGFEVILDNDQELALIKNTTSSECYFTHIGNIPELTEAGGNQFRPLLVSQEESQVSSGDAEIVQFQLSGEIPANFIQAVTGPDMEMQC